MISEIGFQSIQTQPRSVIAFKKQKKKRSVIKIWLDLDKDLDTLALIITFFIFFEDHALIMTLLL